MTKLKLARLSQGLRQEDLEQAVSRRVKRWRIALAESGKFKLSDEEIKILSMALKITPDGLLEEVRVR